MFYAVVCALAFISLHKLYLIHFLDNFLRMNSVKLLPIKITQISQTTFYFIIFCPFFHASILRRLALNRQRFLSLNHKSAIVENFLVFLTATHLHRHFSNGISNKQKMRKNQTNIHKTIEEISFWKNLKQKKERRK